MEIGNICTRVEIMISKYVSKNDDFLSLMFQVQASSNGKKNKKKNCLGHKLSFVKQVLNQEWIDRRNGQLKKFIWKKYSMPIFSFSISISSESRLNLCLASGSVECWVTLKKMMFNPFYCKGEHSFCSLSLFEALLSETFPAPPFEAVLQTFPWAFRPYCLKQSTSQANVHYKSWSP